MSSSHDPFSARFDAIEIDPARAPSAAALDHALAIAAPAADLTTPGFYLLDDAGGRFEVDHDFGVISLRDEAILAGESGAVHTARLRVVEQSGATYEMEVRLRLTGRVPQVVGAEDSAFLVTMAGGEAHQPAPVAAQATTPQGAAPAPEAESLPAVAPWTKYAAAHAALGKADLVRTRRAFISPEMPPSAVRQAELSIDERLPPVGLRDPWMY